MAKAEFCILEGSNLVGKTIGQLEKDYKVTVDHIHNPEFSESSRLMASDERVIDERLIIKVVGAWEDIAKVTKDSVPR